MHRPTTRRDLIRTGIVGAAAAVAGGAALRDASLAEADIFGDAHGDAAVLERIVAIEQLIAFAYDHVISRIPLSPKAAALVRSFASQEREHVRLLPQRIQPVDDRDAREIVARRW